MNKCRRFSGGPAKQRELLISSDVQSGSLTRRSAERVMFLPHALKGARAPSPNIGIFKHSLCFPEAGKARCELYLTAVSSGVKSDFFYEGCGDFCSAGFEGKILPIVMLNVKIR